MDNIFLDLKFKNYWLEYRLLNVNEWLSENYSYEAYERLTEHTWTACTKIKKKKEEEVEF